MKDHVNLQVFVAQLAKETGKSEAEILQVVLSMAKKGEISLLSEDAAQQNEEAARVGKQRNCAEG